MAVNHTAPACHRPPTALAKQLEVEIAKDFVVTESGGKPKITFPCDGLGAVIDDIVFETGSGHGGTLSVYRAHRRGDSYDIRGVAITGNGSSPRPNVPFHRYTGRVTLDIAKLRAATTATITEVVPQRRPGETAGSMSSFSSNDFHVLIRLTDSEGRVVERRYTGYQNSSDQSRFLGLAVAEQAMSAVVDGPTQPVPANLIELEDRALFSDRFNAAVPHFDDAFYWWVMERYVDLARSLGTPKVIGGLLTRLTVKDPQDRSQVDARADALQALANITGWNALADHPTAEAAAAEYLAHCR